MKGCNRCVLGCGSLGRAGLFLAVDVLVDVLVVSVLVGLMMIRDHCRRYYLGDLLSRVRASSFFLVAAESGGSAVLKILMNCCFFDGYAFVFLRN